MRTVSLDAWRAVRKVAVAAMYRSMTTHNKEDHDGGWGQCRHVKCMSDRATLLETGAITFAFGVEPPFMRDLRPASKPHYTCENNPTPLPPSFRKAFNNRLREIHENYRVKPFMYRTATGRFASGSSFETGFYSLTRP